MQAVIKIARDNDLWLFSDECYEQLVYDKPFKSCATFSDYDKIITFQSCSKTYAMTGWRIGYTAGEPNVIKAMSKLQGQSTSCPNSIAQHAAVEALTGNQDMINDMVNIFKKRRDLILDGFNTIQNITCDIPKGAFYVFPNISYFLNKSYKGNMIHTSSDLSMLLLKEQHIVTVAGDCFGAPSNIRFSYATSENTISKMIDKTQALFALIK